MAKSDAAHEATDRQIAALERRIVRLYATAEKGLRERVTAVREAVIQRLPAGRKPAAARSRGHRSAFPLSLCEVLPEVQRQAAP